MFCKSNITNFIQNLVQILNFCRNSVQLLKKNHLAEPSGVTRGERKGWTAPGGNQEGRQNECDKGASGISRLLEAAKLQSVLGRDYPRYGTGCAGVTS